MRGSQSLLNIMKIYSLNLDIHWPAIERWMTRETRAFGPTRGLTAVLRSTESERHCKWKKIEIPIFLDLAWLLLYTTYFCNLRFKVQTRCSLKARDRSSEIISGRNYVTALKDSSRALLSLIVHANIISKGISNWAHSLCLIYLVFRNNIKSVNILPNSRITAIFRERAKSGVRSFVCVTKALPPYSCHSQRSKPFKFVGMPFRIFRCIGSTTVQWG